MPMTPNYEKNTSTGTITLYYYLGGKMVAYKEGTTLRYVSKDHLKGTSLTIDTSGTVVGTIKYKPWGETRSSSGVLPSQKFTGQRLDDVGLYLYASKSLTGGTKVNPAKDSLAVSVLWAGRYYDPTLARFIQPDTIVPGMSNPQALNRFSYVLNNPQKYLDNDGHFAIFGVAAGAIAIGGLLGGVAGAVGYAISHQNNWTVGGALGAAAAGAIGGAASVVSLGAAAAVAGTGIGGVMLSSGFSGLGSMAGYYAGKALENVVSTAKGDKVSPATWQGGAAAALAGSAGALAGQAATAAYVGLQTMGAGSGAALNAAVTSATTVEMTLTEEAVVAMAVAYVGNEVLAPAYEESLNSISDQVDTPEQSDTEEMTW